MAGTSYQKDMESQQLTNTSKDGYGSVPEVAVEGQTQPTGERWRSKDFYDPDWENSFDMILLAFMIAFFLALVVLTGIVHPKMYTQPTDYVGFWLAQVGKIAFMSLVAFSGGLVVTQLGVKVNYTRKIQHFCAYLVPLVVNEHQYADNLGDAVIISWWGYFFTLTSFAIFIYPIRTRIRAVDIMFASLDRPEDRPNTLKWMCSQIFIGYVIISLFRTYFEATGQMQAKGLVFIPVIITGIGDGLAEPVGIRFGKHKYATRGLCSDKAYTRSYEGSACVFISGVIAILMFTSMFSNWLQICVALATIPITMTLAEAYSPHTWDTPFLMLTGCFILWGITFL